MLSAPPAGDGRFAEALEFQLESGRDPQAVRVRLLHDAPRSNLAFEVHVTAGVQQIIHGATEALEGASQLVDEALGAVDITTLVALVRGAGFEYVQVDEYVVSSSGAFVPPLPPTASPSPPPRQPVPLPTVDDWKLAAYLLCAGSSAVLTLGICITGGRRTRARLRRCVATGWKLLARALKLLARRFWRFCVCQQRVARAGPVTPKPAIRVPRPVTPAVVEASWQETVPKGRRDFQNFALDHLDGSEAETVLTGCTTSSFPAWRPPPLRPSARGLSSSHDIAASESEQPSISGQMTGGMSPLAVKSTPPQGLPDSLHGGDVALSISTLPAPGATAAPVQASPQKRRGRPAGGAAAEARLDRWFAISFCRAVTPRSLDDVDGTPSSPLADQRPARSGSPDGHRLRRHAANGRSASSARKGAVHSGAVRSTPTGTTRLERQRRYHRQASKGERVTTSGASRVAHRHARQVKRMALKDVHDAALLDCVTAAATAEPSLFSVAQKLESPARSVDDEQRSAHSMSADAALKATPGRLSMRPRNAVIGIAAHLESALEQIAAWTQSQLDLDANSSSATSNASDGIRLPVSNADAEETSTCGHPMAAGAAGALVDGVDGANWHGEVVKDVGMDNATPKALQLQPTARSTTGATQKSNHSSESFVAEQLAPHTTDDATSARGSSVLPMAEAEEVVAMNATHSEPVDAQEMEPESAAQETEPAPAAQDTEPESAAHVTEPAATAQETESAASAQETQPAAADEMEAAAACQSEPATVNEEVLTGADATEAASPATTSRVHHHVGLLLTDHEATACPPYLAEDAPELAASDDPVGASQVTPPAAGVANARPATCAGEEEGAATAATEEQEEEVLAAAERAQASREAVRQAAHVTLLQALALHDIPRIEAAAEAAIAAGLPAGLVGALSNEILAALRHRAATRVRLEAALVDALAARELPRLVTALDAATEAGVSGAVIEEATSEVQRLEEAAAERREAEATLRSALLAADATQLPEQLARATLAGCDALLVDAAQSALALRDAMLLAEDALGVDGLAAAVQAAREAAEMAAVLMPLVERATAELRRRELAEILRAAAEQDLRHALSGDDDSAIDSSFARATSAAADPALLAEAQLRVLQINLRRTARAALVDALAARELPRLVTALDAATEAGVSGAVIEEATSEVQRLEEAAAERREAEATLRSALLAADATQLPEQLARATLAGCDALLVDAAQSALALRDAMLLAEDALGVDGLAAAVQAAREAATAAVVDVPLVERAAAELDRRKRAVEMAAAQRELEEADAAEVAACRRLEELRQRVEAAQAAAQREADAQAAEVARVMAEVAERLEAHRQRVAMQEEARAARKAEMLEAQRHELQQQEEARQAVRLAVQRTAVAQQALTHADGLGASVPSGIFRCARQRDAQRVVRLPPPWPGSLTAGLGTNDAQLDLEC